MCHAAYSMQLTFLLQQRAILVHKFHVEIFALLGCYAVQSGSKLATFRDNLSVQSSSVKQMLLFLIITPLTLFNNLFVFVFVLYSCFLFWVFGYFVLFCVLFLLLYIAVSFLFLSSLPTAVTGWKPNSSK